LWPGTAGIKRVKGEATVEIVYQQLLQLLVAGIEFMPKLVLAIVVFLVSLVLARLAGRAVVRAAHRMDNEISKLMGRLTTIGLIVVGGVIALDQVDFDVTGFVAGLGLVGFTLGFAFQDIAKNFMAGILLLMQQPFEIGDAIEVSGFTGEVTDIDIRATTIKAWDGQEIIVPNAEVYTSAITNYSKYPARRSVLAVGLGYEEDIARAQDLFLKAVIGIEDVLEDPAPAVHCTGLGSSSVEMGVYFWVDQTRSSLLEVTSRAVQALKETAASEGIDLPYPVQTIRLRQLADEEQL
jgi:small conductance mechanosensitive channel